MGAANKKKGDEVRLNSGRAAGGGNIEKRKDSGILTQFEVGESLPVPIVQTKAGSGLYRGGAARVRLVGEDGPDKPQ